MRVREDFYEILENFQNKDLRIEKKAWEEYEEMKRVLKQEDLNCKEYELKIREIVDFLGI